MKGLINRLSRTKSVKSNGIQLLNHLINSPMFCEPGRMETYLNDCRHLALNGSFIDGSAPEQTPDEPNEPQMLWGQYRDSSLRWNIVGKVAILDVSGALTKRHHPGICFDALPSYEGIIDTMEWLIANKGELEIDTILGRFTSPGGEADGLTDAADHIRSLRDKIRLVAYVDGYATSAAYGLASAFSEVWGSKTSNVGSVGVVTYREDHSERLANEGIKVEVFYRGSKKVDGHPAIPLTDAARADIDEQLDMLYDMFTRCVADNLSVSRDYVSNTEAAIFMGKNAIDLKFMHKIATMTTAIELLNDVEYQLNDHLEIDMANEVDTEPQNEVVEPEVTESVEPESDESIEVSASAEPEVTESVEPENVGGDPSQASTEADQEPEFSRSEDDEMQIKLLCEAADVSAELTSELLNSKMSVESIRGILAASTATITSNEPVDQDDKQDHWGTAMENVSKRYKF